MLEIQPGLLQEAQEALGVMLGCSRPISTYFPVCRLRPKGAVGTFALWWFCLEGFFAVPGSALPVFPGGSLC